jgi:hypothetical protein
MPILGLYADVFWAPCTVAIIDFQLLGLKGTAIRGGFWGQEFKILIFYIFTT